ncbi:Uncharacterised protein [Salmonella bongori]|nr:Uncharacterised protein [Salmonella bongori]
MTQFYAHKWLAALGLASIHRGFSGPGGQRCGGGGRF